MKLCQHLFGRDKLVIVVRQALMARDVTDRTDGGSAKFARPLGDVVRHGEDLRSLLVQEQVVVAKVWTAHVPVEVLRLYIEREHVSKQFAERVRYVDHRVSTKVANRFVKVSHLSCGIAFHCSFSLFLKIEH